MYYDLGARNIVYFEQESVYALTGWVLKSY